jgi:hypothetical protein
MDLDAQAIMTSQLGKREFVPTEINYGTVLVPMTDSVLKDSPHRGYGAAYLDVFLEDCLPGSVMEFAGVTELDTCALVYAKAGAIRPKGEAVKGHIGKIVALHQLNLYFEEVRAYIPLSEEQLDQRLRFAQNTGFVLIGPDECFAVINTHDGIEYTFCDVYENNSDGVVRNLAGYYAESIETRNCNMKINDLHATATQQALSKVRGDLYWWARDGMPVNKEQVFRMTQALVLLEAHAPNAPPERNESGSIVKRWFIENGSTSSVSDLVKYSDGWRRYSTWQDAWYFGVWVNPRSFETMTYAEQDVSHVKCDNADQFKQEMSDLAQFYGQSRSPSMMAIGPAGTTMMFDSFTFLEGKIASLQFTHHAPKQDGKRQCEAPLFGSLKLDHPTVEQIQDDQRIDLVPEAFELDLLNPIAFDGAHSASLSKKAGSLQVSLCMADGRELTADVANND